MWLCAGLDGQRVGEAELAGRLDAGGVWRFSRVLRNPAPSAEGLCHPLSAVLGAVNSPSGRLTDLTLMVGCLSSETGGQDGWWRGTTLAAMLGVPRVERLAVVDAESPLPERRWASELSMRPPVVPAPAVDECLDSVPRGVQIGDGTWRTVMAVTGLWQVDIARWTDVPAWGRYQDLAMYGGGSVTVYPDLQVGGLYRQGGWRSAVCDAGRPLTY